MPKLKFITSTPALAITSNATSSTAPNAASASSAADPYPQMSNNLASAFQFTTHCGHSANGQRDEQTRSMVNEAYAPPESGHCAAAPGVENELPGQVRWS